MPRRVDDDYQPKLAPTAADLGEEAYRANLNDHPGPDSATADTAGTVPIWKAPEAENAPPGQHRKGTFPVHIGQDVKKGGGNNRRPGTGAAPK